MTTIRINHMGGRKLMLLSVLFSALFFSACEKNNYSVDKAAVSAPTAAQFVPTTLRVDYYVKSGGPAFKIPVGITNVTGQDREVKFAYTSRNAQSGVQYTAPASITIKAGTSVDTLNFQGIFAGYPSGRKDTVKIKFTDMKGLDRKDSFELILQRYCDVVLNQLTGNYTRCIDNGNYGPYPMGISSFTSTGATTGSIVVTNLWDPGVPTATTVNLNWTNASGFTATIPDQEFYGPADLWVKGTTAGTFSSCDQTFTLRYTLYYKSTGANYYANQVTVMAR